VTLFGADFRGSVDDLRVLALGAFGIVALKLLGNALTAQAKPMLETAAIGVSFVTIVALDVLLIPEHGGLGAAVASSVAYTVGGIAVAVIFSRALASRVSELAPRGTELVWLWRRLREAARPGAT
jgi:Na+-driven multidrug efflux pump